MNRLAKLFEGRKQARDLIVPLRFIPIVTLQLLLFAALAQGQAVSPEAQRQVLGSLTTEGDVYVDESRAPSELTIFSGESLRTGETGTALLTTDTNGSYQISPGSQVDFTGDPRYLAELKSGTISVKSMRGQGRAVVRAGNFVVVPTILNAQTVEKIERMGDGSFLITCSLGNIGIVPMGGDPGLFLEAGQSARISAKNELVALEQPNQSPSQGPNQGPNQGPSQSKGTNSPGVRSYRPLIYLGLAGGATAAIVVVATKHGANRPVVSPSSP
jgi:hypothetical protein